MTTDRPDTRGARACSCGSDATSLNPAEVVVHRTDGPCFIADALNPRPDTTPTPAERNL